MASPVSVVSRVKSSLATPVTVRSAELDSPRSGRTELTTLTRHSSPLVADTSLAKKLDFDASVVAEDEYESVVEHDVDAQLMSDESDKENEINQPQLKTKRPRAAPKRKTKEVSDKYVVEELQSPPIKTPGARRSRRRRIQPLAFWKNERVVYGRRESCKCRQYITLRIAVVNSMLQVLSLLTWASCVALRKKIRMLFSSLQIRRTSPTNVL